MDVTAKVVAVGVCFFVLNFSGCFAELLRKKRYQSYVTSAWSAWGQWSACSATCGYGGKKHRNRDCITVGNYGSCSGYGSESAECGGGPCATWSEWSAYEPCSVTCGHGYQKRSRTCKYGTCTQGYSSERQNCDAGPCPSWTEWGPYGPCSASCGSGTKTRTRSCTHGSLCDGESQQTMSCNAGSCQSWSEWGPWGSCSISCVARYGYGSSFSYQENGYQTRVRQCVSGGYKLTRHKRGTYQSGGDCVGDANEKRQCQPPPPQCATWGEWGSWSSCAKTCSDGYGGDAGTYGRKRECSGYGKCSGSDYESKSCSLPPCPSWSEWGPWSGCTASCKSSSYGGSSSSSSGGGSVSGTQARDRSCSTYGACGHGQSQETRQCSITCKSTYKPPPQTYGNPLHGGSTSGGSSSYGGQNNAYTGPKNTYSAYGSDFYRQRNAHQG